MFQSPGRLLITYFCCRRIGQYMNKLASLLCKEYFAVTLQASGRVKWSLGVARAMPAPIASRFDPITAELHVTPTPPLVLTTVKEQPATF
jgi:hypothetical protein